MKFLTLFPAFLLLLWTLTASVSCKDAAKMEVKTVSDGIVLSCGTGYDIQLKNGELVESQKLQYNDENTGEYACVSKADNENPPDGPKIYVKFRTCDNCVELDLSSIMGIAVGNLLATSVIGVAVYLIASQSRIGSTTSHKKNSDKQHLVPNEVRNRAPNDHYQSLNLKGGQRDTYDVLTKR